MYSKAGDVVIWDCIQNIESGVESCKYSKAMRETMIEKAFVEYVIIGGYVDGQRDSCMIRFICKSGLNDTTCNQLTQEDIVDNQIKY